MAALENLPGPYEHYVTEFSDTLLPATLKFRLRFEEDLVNLLLERYDLADTRTRFCLMDLAKKQRHPGDGNFMTLASWNLFFPGYPVQLYGWRFTPRQQKRVSLPKVWLSFWKSPFIQPHPDFLVTEARCASIVHDWGGQLEELLWSKPSAVIYKWPRDVPLKDSFCVLFDVPLDQSLAVPVFLFRNAHGTQVVLQPLWVVLNTIDQALDPRRNWLASALRPEFKELADQPR